MTTYTMGTVGRDFADLAAWQAAHGAWDISVGGAEADPDYVVEVYNDAAGGAFIDEGTIKTTITIITDATNNITLRAASGTGANGAPNDHTTRADGPVIDDPTKGAGFVSTITFNQFFECAHDIDIENLQFLATGNRGACIDTRGEIIVNVSKSIIRSAHATSNDNFIWQPDDGSEISDCLLVVGDGERAALRAAFKDVLVRNVTGYGSDGAGATQVMEDETAEAKVAWLNCVGTSEAQPAFDAVIDAASTVLGSSDGTPTVPPAGSVSVSMTDGVDIVAFANSTSGDFRAVVSGSLDGAGDGTSGSASATDIFNTPRAATGSTLGCYEIPSAPPAVGNPWYHYRMARSA